jgi:predicted anti-sigma-YlaC factor YlaD
MTCARARRLFGAYWDDEITQGEREWLESHLNACAVCRKEYDALARSLEIVASLPREEAAPDLLERTLARARRASPAPDRLPETQRPWIPVTATAAAAVLVLTVVAPWTGWMTGGVPDTRVSGVTETDTVSEPVAVARPVGTSPSSSADATAENLADLAALPADSLFDHSEDVEFILDPVALRRGRAHPLPASRGSDGVQVERAVISF